jgi:hypothetical protein
VKSVQKKRSPTVFLTFFDAPHIIADQIGTELLGILTRLCFFELDRLSSDSGDPVLSEVTAFRTELPDCMSADHHLRPCRTPPEFPTLTRPAAGSVHRGRRRDELEKVQYSISKVRNRFQLSGPRVMRSPRSVEAARLTARETCVLRSSNTRNGPDMTLRASIFSGRQVRFQEELEKE